MAILFWIILSTIMCTSLLLLLVFDGKRDELRENVAFPDGSFTTIVTENMSTPKDRLRNLDQKLTSKNNRLEISQFKLDETKRTISELEVTSGEVQRKYRELLSQLKSELARTETECLNLHNQIEQITTKRDKLKQELDERRSQFPYDINLSYFEVSPPLPTSRQISANRPHIDVS